MGRAINYCESYLEPPHQSWIANRLTEYAFREL